MRINKSPMMKMLLIGLIRLINSPLQAEYDIKEFKDIPWSKAKGFELTTDI